MLTSVCFIIIYASATNPIGAVSIIILSYLFFKVFINSSNLSLRKTSAGLDGRGPAIIISKFSSTLDITSSTLEEPSNTVDKPIELSTLNPSYNLGLLKSAPKSKVFFPEFAKTTPKLEAINVFPSPLTEEVTKYILSLSSLSL